VLDPNRTHADDTIRTISSFKYKINFLRFDFIKPKTYKKNC
jgi:hypothetical protein